jgi:RNA polymerase sigma-70 factor, ECF subfamily
VTHLEVFVDPGSQWMADQSIPMLNQPASASNDAPGEDFVRILTQSQRALYLFILPMVGRPADAEEVLQETNVVIWSKWFQFDPGTNFLAWGRAIARLEVFRFRRNRHHRMKLLGDEVVDLIADRSETQMVDAELRRDALTRCIEKLRDKDRELIRERYSGDISGDEIAERLGRPANSVYQSIGRIRKTLLECVQRQLSHAPRGTR